MTLESSPVPEARLPLSDALERPRIITTTNGKRRWSDAHDFNDSDRAKSKSPESMAKRLETYRIKREARQARVRALMAVGLDAKQIAALLELRERVARKVMCEVRALEAS